jgi:hypothetical protein
LWLLCVVCAGASVQTPLHLAARHYSLTFLPIVIMLLECGACIGAVDREGNTAAQVTRRICVCVMVAYGCACVCT